jgi:hypothetical protein
MKSSVIMGDFYGIDGRDGLDGRGSDGIFGVFLKNREKSFEVLFFFVYLQRGRYDH